MRRATLPLPEIPPSLSPPTPPSLLPQADCLRSLFVALNEESCVVRSLTIKLVGRLADKNPAYINPALRRHLLQVSGS